MTQEEERLRRWRLVLGEKGCEGMGLSGADAERDRLLAALFGGKLGDGKKDSEERKGGLGESAPSANRWLGDIRQYFPSPVVSYLQQEAIDRFGLTRMLKEKEILDSLTPDVHLAATLVQLKDTLPAETRATARQIIQQIVRDLMRKLDASMRQAISGALNRSRRNNRPRHQEIDWKRTIQLNLKHYQPDLKTIIPERLAGYGRKRAQLEDVILCVDQSGSMAESVVYSSLFAGVMASLPSLKTSLVVFDTSIVDLTELLSDPVEVLFATQLGGGTDIGQALTYCQSLVRRPEETTMVLISDLYEGASMEHIFHRVDSLVSSGVKLIVLLALTDGSAPAYNKQAAQDLANMGVPAFACTPDFFPDLMAAALSQKPMMDFLGARGVKLPKAQ